MRKIAFGLVCLAVAGDGRRVQITRHDTREDGSNSISGVHDPTSDSDWDAELRQSRSSRRLQTSRQVGDSTSLKTLATLLRHSDHPVGWQVAGGARFARTAGRGHSFSLAARSPTDSGAAAGTHASSTGSRTAVHLSTSPSEQEPQSYGVDFTEALCMLHTPAAAAEDQQARLRKGAASDATGPNRRCSGSFLVPDAVPHSSKSVSPDDATDTKAPGPHTVYLVGVGPGDIELLTLKAFRLMQTADLVLYDRLISPEVLQLVGSQASMLYVGKQAGFGKGQVGRQHLINDLLLHYASSGKTVVRLKGGDPTVFGRGGEEMEYLDQHGVRVSIVPGITAASGVAAGIGVPLTHRDHSNSVRFITGHARIECTEPVESRYPWEQLADPNTTLVVYMGLKTLPDLAAGLIAAGLPADTPAVAVQDGTTPTQRLVAAELAKLPEEVQVAGLRSPTLLIIGAVVSLLDSDAVATAAATATAAAAAAVERKEIQSEFCLGGIRVPYFAVDKRLATHASKSDGA